MNSNTITFTGNILFYEDSITQKRFSERGRRITYCGSRMHFFRVLWANDLKSLIPLMTILVTKIL